MTHTKIYNYPIYACKIKFILTDDFINIVAKWYKKNNLQSQEEIVESEGIVLYQSIDDYTLLINTNYLTYNTINHELYHLTRELAEPRSIFEIEAQAWIMGNLSQIFYSFINKKQLTIKCNINFLK